MQKLGLNEVREKYLSFFESKDHLRLPSVSLVPYNDNSLLIINSGMAPFKAYFKGQETPPSKRVTTCQKCIRTTDIENVGKTSRHGTFFEMLGNFSFGEYFKEEIIPWAWEFVTEVLEIPASKLYASVYLEDDEAYEIWRNKIGLEPNHIVRLGKEDNFWEHGIGPCGPCSEIYFDRGEEEGCGKDTCAPGCDCDRFVEIWNLVFTQFDKGEDGSYSRLENPNIDTGMGLERVAAMLQGVNSIFDVDTLQAVIAKVCEIANVKYNESPKQDESIRIITDHIRSVTFMTADGIHPSNEGRGYVLRRLLRRAARHGKLLGIQGTFLTDLSKTVVEVSKHAYPELVEKQDYIYKLISVEEDRFYETIDYGMQVLKQLKQSLRDSLQKTLAGGEAFKLYDTYGFPLELMQEILEEEGFGVDVAAFREEMEKQRSKGRLARAESTYMGADETVYNKIDMSITSTYVGYETMKIDDAQILALIVGNDLSDEGQAGDEVSILTDKTPLYAESGGQKGDQGVLSTPTGTVEVFDCIKVSGNRIAQLGKIVSGTVKKGQKAIITVDHKKRMDTARNHSATHLLQKALREVLGGHVEQAGSSVDSERLRFDFTHFSAMTKEELKKVEEIVNDKILEALDVVIEETTIEQAREKGAMALFGEKYGATVRMVRMGDFSIELCGGTHLQNTAQAGTFKILSESGISAGIRRIEAVTGRGALGYYRQLDKQLDTISSFLKATPNNIISKVEFYMNQAKEYGRELSSLRSKISGNAAEDLIKNAEVVKGVSVITKQVDGLDMDGMKTMGDQLKDKLGSGVIVLAGGKDGKYSLLVMVTESAVKAGANAGGIIRAAAEKAGGKGGGRPNMAQAGIKDPTKIAAALERAREVIGEQIK